MLFAALSPWANHVWRVAMPAALGLVAVFLLLPRPRPLLRVAGVALAFLAAVAAGFVLLHTSGRPVYDTLFYFFAFVAVVAGGMLVTQSNPVHAALSFALVVLSTCGLFLILAAPFLMAATIIVYAGAIIVTFLFVIMLAQQQGLSDADSRSREPFSAPVACFVLLPTLLFTILQTYDTGQQLERVVAKAEVRPGPKICHGPGRHRRCGRRGAAGKLSGRPPGPALEAGRRQVPEPDQWPGQ